MINEHLFSLISLSIGVSKTINSQLSTDEWGELYRMAVKQSLVGVCYAGVRKCMEIAKLQREKISIPDKLYYLWLGTAVQIQQRNELMNQKCLELQSKLNSSGFKCSILKGQGVAALYGELKDLRQPGDIDVWCQGHSIKQIVAYLENQGYAYHATFAHVETDFFEGVPVEFHAYPSFFRCPWKNIRLQKWINSFDLDNFNDFLGFRTPPFEFNVIFLLMHMFHHVVHEGLGLRQLMDYYFLLKYNHQTYDYSNYTKTIEYLGLSKFAGAVMWVLKKVFCLENERLLCLPDEKLGTLLLEEILEGGNFGKYTSKQKGLREKNAILRTYNYEKRRLRFFMMAPEEVIFAPFWSLWHYIWRKQRGY